MGLMNVRLRKNMKMASNSRHLCLFILLFSVVVSLCSAQNESSYSKSEGNGAHTFGPTNFPQFKAKYNNRDLSEISVEKPQQTTQHHHLHHFRHQNGHNSVMHHPRSNGTQHHKQHNHQSSDSAYNRIPGYQRQAHATNNKKKQQQQQHTHYDFDDASDGIGRGGFHKKNHLHHQHHHQQQQQQEQQRQSHALTTLGPNRGRSFSRSNSWPSSAEIIGKRNWSDNLSRNRQVPHPNTYSSMNRSRTHYNPYSPHMRAHHTTRHTTPTTTTTSTTTTTTTTVAPDVQEKVLFDAQSNFNNIDSDEMDDDIDYDSDYDETFDTKKRSPSFIGPFDRDYKTSPQSSENFQRDDPVRSSSSNNGITTSVFKSQPTSSAGDNYQLNVNNDGSTNNNNNYNYNSPTSKTSKSVGDDVKITNSMTRNIQTRNGALTEEKYRTLGTAEAVKKTFNARLDPELDSQVRRHMLRVYQYSSCRPKMKVIPVPHDPTKTFNPHCTVLHRCSDDSGCCLTDSRTCQPLHIENVTLAFYVTTVAGDRVIELIPFENHTDCQCVSKISVRSSTQPTRIDSSQLVNDAPAPRVEAVKRTVIVPITTTTEMPVRCQCPNHFTRINGYQCKCDCSSKSSPTNGMCNKLKMGLEHFSITERRCILSESCERPTCAYGEFDIKAGHCPRKDEALTFSSNDLNSD